jgi:hypothetical protein
VAGRTALPAGPLALAIVDGTHGCAAAGNPALATFSFTPSLQPVFAVSTFTPVVSPVLTAPPAAASILSVSGTLFPFNSSSSSSSTVTNITMAGLPCLDGTIQVKSASLITCAIPGPIATPAPPPGPVVVTLSSGLTAASAGSFTFSDAAGPPTPPPTPTPTPLAPLVSSINPSSAPFAVAGTTVTLRGGSLGATSAADIASITLAGVACAPVVWTSPAEITCTAGARPAGVILAGPVAVQVVMVLGTSSTSPNATAAAATPAATTSSIVAAIIVPGVAFSYVHLAPVVSAVSPDAGPVSGGNVVTLHGAFPEDDTSALLGTVPCTSPLAVVAPARTAALCIVAAAFAPAMVGQRVPVTASGATGGAAAATTPPLTYLVTPPYSTLIKVDAFVGRRVTDEDQVRTALVTLSLDPSVNAQVTVDIVSSDPGEGRPDPPQVVLSPARSTAEVIFRGVPDAVRDGNQTYEALLQTSAPTAPQYTGLFLAPILLVNMDSAPGIELVQPGVSALAGRIITITGANFDTHAAITIGGSPATEIATTMQQRMLARSTDARADNAPDDAAEKPSATNPFFRVQQAAGSPAGASTAAAATQTGTFVLRSPALAAQGYKIVTLQNLNSSTYSERTGLIFYTDDCPEPGMFGRGTDCRECPVGGICPGGYRIRPLPGYWNPSEDSGYVQRCSPPESCTGCLGSVVPSDCYRFNVAAPCSFGYMGEYCSQCLDAPKFYRPEPQGPCVPCPRVQELVPMVIGFCSLWAFVSLVGVFAVQRSDFSHVAQVMIVIQEVSGVGSKLAPFMPRWVLRAYDVLYLFSGDMRFLAASCSGDFDIVTEFYIACAFFVAIGIPMHILCFVAGKIAVARARRAGSDEAAEARRGHYRNRQIRLLCAHASLVYYAIAVRCLGIVTCVPLAGEYRLARQLSTVCYEGPHVVATAIAAAILALFTIAWPVFNLVSGLSETAAARLYGDPDYAERWDWYYEPFKPHLRLLWIGEIFVAIGIAIGQTLLVGRPHTQLAISGGLFFVLVLSTALLRPYDQGYENITMSMLYASHLLASVLVYLVSAGHVTETSSVNIIVFVIIGFAGIVLLSFVGVAAWRLLVSDPPLREHYSAPQRLKSDRRRRAEERAGIYDGAGGGDIGEFEYYEDDDPTGLAAPDQFDSTMLVSPRGGASADPWNSFLSIFGMGNSHGPGANVSLQQQHQEHQQLQQQQQQQQRRCRRRTAATAPAGAAAAVAASSARAAARGGKKEAEQAGNAAPAMPDAVNVLALCPTVIRRPAPESDGLLETLTGFVLGDPLAPAPTPATWTAPPTAARGALVDVTASMRPAVQAALSATCRAEHIGTGVDAVKGATYNSFEVVAVHRVEHPRLWADYAFAVSKVARDAKLLRTAVPAVPVATDTTQLRTTADPPLCADAGEKLLFHGTSAAVSEIIVASGFDDRVSRTGMFGSGLYAAELSSKADEYADDGELCKMFVVRAVLGNPYVALSAMPYLRRPPCVQGHVGAPCSHERFDSVLAEVATPGGVLANAVLTKAREFVLYRGAFMYPSLLVTYKRVQK